MKKSSNPMESTNGSLHTYGWKPGVPDRRDVRYGEVRSIPATLPANVDLRTLCSKGEDQGDLNSVAPQY